MGSNPDYCLKSFLLYIKLHKTSTSLCVAKMCDVRRMKLPAYKLRKKMSLTVGHWGTKYWHFFLKHCWFYILFEFDEFFWITWVRIWLLFHNVFCKTNSIFFKLEQKPGLPNTKEQCIIPRRYFSSQWPEFPLCSYKPYL